MNDKPTNAEAEAYDAKRREAWGKSVIFEDQYEIRYPDMGRDVVTCDRINHKLNILCDQPAEYVVQGQYRTQPKGRYSGFSRRLCAGCAAEWATLHGLAFPPEEDEE